MVALLKALAIEWLTKGKKKAHTRGAGPTVFKYIRIDGGTGRCRSP
jgi:hypothetical protein